MKLIDKEKIVAELKRRIKECDKLANAAADNNLSNSLQANELLIRQYTSLLHFLDTLETKDVDETIKNAEDHAYFAGSENTREKLIDKACSILKDISCQIEIIEQFKTRIK